MSANAGWMLALAATLLGAPSPGRGHVEPGTLVEGAELPTLTGGRHALLVPGQVNVLVFFRPEQDRSGDTLAGWPGASPSSRASRSTWWAWCRRARRGNRSRRWWPRRG